MLPKMLPSIVTNIYSSGRYKLQKQNVKYKIPIRNTCKLFIIYTVSSFCWLYLISYSQKKYKCNHKNFAQPFSLFQEIVISNFPLFQQNYTTYTKETAENIILKKQTHSFAESVSDSGLSEIPRYIKGCQKKLNNEDPKQMSLLFREISIQNYIGRLKTNNGVPNWVDRQHKVKGIEVPSKRASFQRATENILGPDPSQNRNKEYFCTKQGTELLFFARKPLFPLLHQSIENVPSSWMPGGYKEPLSDNQIVQKEPQTQNNNSYKVNRDEPVRSSTVGKSSGCGGSLLGGSRPSSIAGQPSTDSGKDEGALTKGSYEPHNRNYETKRFLIGPEFDLLPRRLEKVNKQIISNKKLKLEKTSSRINSLSFKPKLGQTEQLQLCNYSNIDKLISLGFPLKYTPKEKYPLGYGADTSYRISRNPFWAASSVAQSSLGDHPFSQCRAQFISSLTPTSDIIGVRSKGVPTLGKKVKLVYQAKTNAEQIDRTFSLYNPLYLNKTNSFRDFVIDSRLQSGFTFPDAPVINKNSMFLKKQNILAKKQLVFLKNTNYISPTASISSNYILNKGHSFKSNEKTERAKVALPPVHLTTSDSIVGGSKPIGRDLTSRGDLALQSFLSDRGKDSTGHNPRHFLGKSRSQPSLQSLTPTYRSVGSFLHLVYKQKPVQGYMSYDQTHGYVHLNKKSPAADKFAKEQGVRGFPRAAFTFRALTPTYREIETGSSNRTFGLQISRATELWDFTAQNLFSINLPSTEGLIFSKQKKAHFPTESPSNGGDLSSNFKRSNLAETNTVDQASPRQDNNFEDSSSTGFSKFFVPIKRVIQKTQSLVGFNKLLGHSSPLSRERSRSVLLGLPTWPSRTYPFVILNNNADIKTFSNNLEKPTNFCPDIRNQQGHVPESFFGTPYLQLGERFTIEHLKGKNQMGLLLNVHTGDVLIPDALSYSTSLGSGTLTYTAQSKLSDSVGRSLAPHLVTPLFPSDRVPSGGQAEQKKQLLSEQLHTDLSFSLKEKTSRPHVGHGQPPAYPFASTGTSFTTVFGKKRLTKLKSKKMQSPVTNGRLVYQWSSTNSPYSKIENSLKETSGVNLLPGTPTITAVVPTSSEVPSVGQDELNTKESLHGLLYFKRIAGKANRHIINPFKYYNPGTKRDRNIEDTLLTLEGYKKSRLFAQTHTYYGGITIPFLPIDFLQSYPLSTIHDLALWDPHLQSILGGMRQRTESQRIAQNVTGAPPINNEEFKKFKSQNSSGSNPLMQEEAEHSNLSTYGQHESDTSQNLSGDHSTPSGYSNNLILEHEQSRLFQGYNKENKRKRYRSTNCYPLRTLLAVRSQKAFLQNPIQPTDRLQYIYGSPTSLAPKGLWSDHPSQLTGGSYYKGPKESLYSKPSNNITKGSGKTKGLYFENMFSTVIRIQKDRMCFSDQPLQKYTSLLDVVRSNQNVYLKWGRPWTLAPLIVSVSKILFFIGVWSGYKILAKGLLNPSGASQLSQSTQFLPTAFTEAIGLQTFQQKYRIITAKKTTQSFKNLAGAEKTLSELRDLIWTFHLVGTGGPRGEHSPFTSVPYLGGQAGQERTSVISKARNRFLLVGPPGTGKTLLVKTLAAEANVPVIVQPASQLRMIAGVENPVSALFRVARQIKPCIIFLDELDTLGNNFNISTTGTTAEQKLGIRLARKYTYTLLLELDGLTSSTRDLLIIGATNRPETLNPALTRSGRFDTFINCNIPSQEQRFAVLSLYLSNQNQKGENIILQSTKESLLNKGASQLGRYSKDNVGNPETSNQRVLSYPSQDKKEIEHFYINYIAQKCYGLSHASIGAIVNQSALESMLDFSPSSFLPSLLPSFLPSEVKERKGKERTRTPHTLKTLERAIESVKLLTPHSNNRTFYQQTPHISNFIPKEGRKEGRSVFYSANKKKTLNCSTKEQGAVPLDDSFGRVNLKPRDVATQGLRNNTEMLLHQLGSYVRVVRSKLRNRPIDHSPSTKVEQGLPKSGLGSRASFKQSAFFPHSQILQFCVYKAYQTSSSAIVIHLTQCSQPVDVSRSSLAYKDKTLTNITFTPGCTHPTDRNDLEDKILKGYAQHASVNIYGATRPQNLRFSEVFGLCHTNLESNLLTLKHLVLTSVNKTTLTQDQRPFFYHGTATEASLFEQEKASVKAVKANRNTGPSGMNVEKVQNQNQQNSSSRLFATTNLTTKGSSDTMHKQVTLQIRNSDPVTTGWFRMYLSRPIVRYDNLSYIENKEYYPQNNYVLRRCFVKSLHSRNISTLGHSFLNFETNKQQIRYQRDHGIEGKIKQQKLISNKSVMQYSTPFDHYFNNQIQPIFLTIVAYFFHKMCVIVKDNRELVDYCVYSQLRYSVLYDFSMTQICTKF